ncbi:hypothetical protein CGLO_12498 [Colletotrichum gloeosporioides Cg-14]|uniref:Uncharacterized protein n=1 Tax=Colletotrichum gloeosporioides (strain Cg-14) TaxID=1237896 RepID=T0JYE6_COLGC|nr:hypothetical protein CGLO_12498 [Colletotrichum gloeosporioides Cg-14]
MSSALASFAAQRLGSE